MGHLISLNFQLAKSKQGYFLLNFRAKVSQFQKLITVLDEERFSADFVW